MINNLSYLNIQFLYLLLQCTYLACRLIHLFIHYYSLLTWLLIQYSRLYLTQLSLNNRVLRLIFVLLLSGDTSWGWNHKWFRLVWLIPFPVSPSTCFKFPYLLWIGEISFTFNHHLFIFTWVY
jgi:hypothetical protein